MPLCSELFTRCEEISASPSVSSCHPVIRGRFSAAALPASPRCKNSKMGSVNDNVIFLVESFRQACRSIAAAWDVAYCVSWKQISQDLAMHPQPVPCRSARLLKHFPKKISPPRVKIPFLTVLILYAPDVSTGPHRTHHQGYQCS